MTSAIAFDILCHKQRLTRWLSDRSWHTRAHRCTSRRTRRVFIKRGNLLSRTRTDGTGSEAFAWDYRNRLTTLIEKNGQGNTTLTAGYAYDAFDRRIRKTLSGSQSLDEQYLYDGTTDGDTLLVLDGSGNLKLRQFRGLSNTEVFAEDRFSGGTVTSRWTLCDHEGSIREVISNAGTVVDHLQYGSFGNIQSQSNAQEQARATYTAAPVDAETGFVYLYHRYYDPASGRFISQDPKGFGAGDANLYRYVGNDPFDRTDPLGLRDEKLEWGVGVQARFGFDGRGLVYQGIDLTAGVGYKVATDVQVRLDMAINVYNGGIGTENQRQGFGWDHMPTIDATAAVSAVVGGGRGTDAPVYLTTPEAASALPDTFENSFRLGQAVMYTGSMDRLTFQGLHGIDINGLTLDYHNDAIKGFNPVAWATNDSTDYGWTGGGGISLPVDGMRLDLRHETYTGIGMGYYLQDDRGLDPQNSAGGGYGTHLQSDSYESNRTDTSVKVTDRASGAGFGLHVSTPATVQELIHDSSRVQCPVFAMPDQMDINGASSRRLPGAERVSTEVYLGISSSSDR